MVDADDAPTCAICEVRLTFIRHHHDTLADRVIQIYPANLSPNRVIPASRGGQYTADNVQLLCLGLQYA